MRLPLSPRLACDPEVGPVIRCARGSRECAGALRLVAGAERSADDVYACATHAAELAAPRGDILTDLAQYQEMARHRAS
ncbi:hypothetical protein [Streptomyces exfoliatus]|uniref:hypothetical protein n=1 Tax=Streptomyces exfoliatus TaxID=1905 RepID=UPI0012FEE415|nr:hypothetical protein [Streptomyces exfoliatus]